VAPSSRTLARAMAKGLTIGDDESVVELGPGTGALTDQIRHILPHDGGYLGIEIEPRFVDRSGVGRSRRLKVPVAFYRRRAYLLY